MTDLAKLVVRLEAQTGKYQKDLERANGKLDKFAKNTKKSVGNIKAAFAGLAVGAAVRGMIRATAQQEQALAQLEQGLKSTGNTAGFTKDELVGYAEELQKATTFGDEDIINAQANLLTFTKIAGEQFNRTTEAALNLSTRVGQDLKSSVIQLGKALNDPVANLGALSRSGIQFSDTQKDLIKDLAETGRLAEAQTLILDELETQYGGSARAARDTFGGALEGLKNAFGDLLEAPGGMSDAQDGIENFTAILQKPETLAAAQTLTGGLIEGFSLVARGITASIKPLRLASVTISFVTEGMQDLAGTTARYLSLIAPGVAGDALKSFSLSMEGAAEETRQFREELLETIAISDGVIPDLKTPEVNDVESSVNLKARVQAPSFDNKDLDDLARKQEEATAKQLEQVIQGLKFEEELLLESYNKRHEIIMSSTTLTGEEKKALELRLIDDTLQEVEVKTKELQKEVQDNAETQAEAFDRIFGSGALTQLFSDLDNIEERFKSLLANIAAQALASGLANMFSGGAGGFGGGVSSFFGGLFGGARANGGPVSASSTYLVGERGPELFVPNTGGNIVPNEAMGGGGDVRIINQFQDGVIDDYLGSASGERLIMNVVSRNQRTIQSLSR